MEQFSGTISVLLQHSQRFFEIWNFHIVISLALLGFVLSNQEAVSKIRVRLLITIVFTLIAAYSIFSLSIHQKREEKLWIALDARVVAASVQYTPEEMDYFQSLKPTNFSTKAGALIGADLLVILVTWMSPRGKRDVPN